MTIADLRDAEQFTYLVIHNNPTEAAYFLGEMDKMDYSSATPDELCQRAAALVASGQQVQLSQAIGQVRVDRENLQPETLNSVIQAAQANARKMGYKSFDWGNMEFWGQVASGLLVIGGAAAANAQPGGTATPGPTSGTEVVVTEVKPDYTNYYIGGGLVIAGLIALYLLTRKKAK